MLKQWAERKLPGAAINLSTHIDLREAHLAQPRAVGAASLSVCADECGRTRLKSLRHSGSTKLVFPTVHRTDVEAILVNTAGGITGGDDYRLDVTVETGAALTMTTQAAERAYRAQPDEMGSVEVDLKVQGKGQLSWLPQELILFDRCALTRRLIINLEEDAQLLMVEPVVFGRALMDETLRGVRFRDRIIINRDGRPLYVDGMHLDGEATAHLCHSAIAGGAKAMASVVLVRPDAQNQLSAVRKALPETAGASLLAEDVLVIRHLAADSYALRCLLVPILERLTDNTLPTSWRL